MFILDTNVHSELSKTNSRCDWGVRRWFDETNLEEIYLSVIVLGEIRKAVEVIRRQDSIRATNLERLAFDLRPRSGRFVSKEPFQARTNWIAYLHFTTDSVSWVMSIRRVRANIGE